MIVRWHSQTRRAALMLSGMTPSPCTQVCEIDPDSRLCRGCGRTLAEIAAWPAAGEAERRRIVAAAHNRKQRAVA